MAVFMIKKDWLAENWFRGNTIIDWKRDNLV